MPDYHVVVAWSTFLQFKITFWLQVSDLVNMLVNSVITSELINVDNYHVVCAWIMKTITSSAVRLFLPFLPFFAVFSLINCDSVSPKAIPGFLSWFSTLLLMQVCVNSAALYKTTSFSPTSNTMISDESLVVSVVWRGAFWHFWTIFRETR